MKKQIVMYIIDCDGKAKRWPLTAEMRCFV